MKQTIESLKEKLISIRAGRANPSMLNGIMVDFYGTPTPIASVANITVPEARQLFVKPFDRSTIKNIEKAINEANIGIAPTNNGEMIILSIPELNEERRREYVKQAKSIGEEAKVALRNIRQDANNEIKKQEYPEDEEKMYLEDVQELINYFIVESFYGNTDLGNIRFWKSDNGKWRWMLYDLDWSLWNTSLDMGYPIKQVKVPAATYLSSSITIIRRLYRNSEFKDLYLSSLAKYLKTTFKPERMNNIVDELSKEIENEMEYHIKRWGSQYPNLNSMSRWKSNLSSFKKSLTNRYNKVVSNLKSYFNLSNYLLIFASGNDNCEDQKLCQTNFKLSKDGEMVTLIDKTGNIISRVTFPKLNSDMSYSYINGKYEVTSPTPYKENILITNNKNNNNDYHLEITEYMTHNKSISYLSNGKFYDWIEIHNLSDDTTLANVSLSDDSNNLNKYILPDVTIKKDEYKVIYLTGGEKVDDYLCANFKLSDNDKEIVLSYNNKVLDKVDLVTLKDNMSYGKYEDRWYYYYLPTPGSINNTSKVEVIEDGNP